MPPHLHPRSRSTTSLFVASLFASFVVVGLPHLFPCPAPRRTLADSEMATTPDGQPVQRFRRRRRKEVDSSDEPETVPSRTPPLTDDEVSTFLQLEAEAENLSQRRRECPIPKPGGIVGELLGFKNQGDKRPQKERNDISRSDASS